MVLSAAPAGSSASPCWLCIVKDRRYLCLSEKDRFPQTKILTNHRAFRDVLWGILLPPIRVTPPGGVGREKETPKEDLSGSSVD